MKTNQRQNTAKYLYDISKIIVTIAIIGNLMTRNKFDIVAFISGSLGAIITFFWAYSIDSKEDK
jgi:hypothetical protein